MNEPLKVDDIILLTYKGEVYSKGVIGTTVIGVVIGITYDYNRVTIQVISDNSTGDSQFQVGKVIEYNLNVFEEFREGSKNYKYVELTVL